jgi:hypothetical protein
VEGGLICLKSLGGFQVTYRAWQRVPPMAILVEGPTGRAPAAFDFGLGS